MGSPSTAFCHWRLWWRGSRTNARGFAPLRDQPAPDYSPGRGIGAVASQVSSMLRSWAVSGRQARPGLRNSGFIAGRGLGTLRRDAPAAYLVFDLLLVGGKSLAAQRWRDRRASLTRTLRARPLWVNALVRSSLSYYSSP